jgi:hypothetical protein
LILNRILNNQLLAQFLPIIVTKSKIKLPTLVKTTMIIKGGDWLERNKKKFSQSGKASLS